MRAKTREKDTYFEAGIVQSLENRGNLWKKLTNLNLEERQMDINYKQCAINCVGGDTLKQYKKQFDECNQDFDLLFSRDTGDQDFYRKIIEPGHIYETGYPRCICWQNDDSKDKCECSRQAIIYLYSQLLPNSEITVETIQTVRMGGESCRFRIILGKQL
jgi:hypothetical protein